MAFLKLVLAVWMVTQVCHGNFFFNLEYIGCCAEKSENSIFPKDACTKNSKTCIFFTS